MTPDFQDTIGYSQGSREEMRAASESLTVVDIPGYQLARELGRGTFGVVWEATRLQTGQQVAIKVVRGDQGLNWQYLQRELDFLRELEDHPYTLTVLDAELQHDPPYIVTPLVDGGSLDSVGKERERDLVLVRRWIEQLAEALQFVHDKGVIHCDLKPSNVFVSSSDDIRLGDFGQCRPAMGTEAAWGTLGFMAPEQCVEPETKISPTVRWDVYGFGATSYWLLTGRIPRLNEKNFDGDLTGYRKALTNSPLQPICELNPKVNKNLAAIVEACLVLAPEKRTQSMANVAEDLQRWRKGVPLLCRRPWSVPYLLGVALRHPMIQLGLLFFLFLIGLGVFGWRRQQERSFEFHVTAGLHAEESGRVTEAYLHWARALDYRRQDKTTRARLELMPLTRVFPHEGPVNQLLFLPNKQQLATASGDNQVQLWQSATGQLVRTYDLGSPVGQLAYSPQTGLLASGSWDGSVRLLNPESSEPVQSFSHGEMVEILALEFSHDGQSLVSADFNGVLKIWRGDGQVGPTPEQSPEQEYFNPVVATHPSEPLFAAIWDPGGARLWSLQDGKVRSPILRHQGEINAMAFSPDGKVLATASDDLTCRLWEVSSGRLLATLPHQSRIYTIAFNSRGLLATGTEEGDVLIWDPQEPAEARFVFRHRQPVRSLDFSSDGHYLGVGTGERYYLLSGTLANGAAQVWDATTGQSVAGPWPHIGPVVDVEFEPEDQHLATASGSDRHTSALHPGTVRLWNLGLPRTSGGTAKPQSRSEDPPKRPDGEPYSHGDLPLLEYLNSPDGAQLASVAADFSLRLWNLENGEEEIPQIIFVPPSLAPPEAKVRLSFSSDGRWIATGSNVLNGYQVQIWEARSGAPVSPALACPVPVEGLEFSSDDALLKVSGQGQTYAWELLPEEDDRALKASTGSRLQALLSPSGKVLGTHVMNRHD